MEACPRVRSAPRRAVLRCRSSGESRQRDAARLCRVRAWERAEELGRVGCRAGQESRWRGTGTELHQPSGEGAEQLGCTVSKPWDGLALAVLRLGSSGAR